MQENRSESCGEFLSIETPACRRNGPLGHPRAHYRSPQPYCKNDFPVGLLFARVRTTIVTETLHVVVGLLLPHTKFLGIIRPSQEVCRCLHMFSRDHVGMRRYFFCILKRKRVLSVASTARERGGGDGGVAVGVSREYSNRPELPVGLALLWICVKLTGNLPRREDSRVCQQQSKLSSSPPAGRGSDCRASAAVPE